MDRATRVFDGSGDEIRLNDATQPAIGRTGGILPPVVYGTDVCAPWASDPAQRRAVSRSAGPSRAGGRLSLGVTPEPNRQGFHGARWQAIAPQDRGPVSRRGDHAGGIAGGRYGNRCQRVSQSQLTDLNAQLTWCWRRTPWGTSAKCRERQWQTSVQSLPKCGPATAGLINEMYGVGTIIISATTVFVVVPVAVIPAIQSVPASV